MDRKTEGEAIVNKDYLHRRMAEAVLQQATKVVTQDRGNQHGGVEDSFQMIADMWTAYVRHATKHRDEKDKVFSYHDSVTITSVDVAQLMVILKICRSVYGDPKHGDNYVDQAGYSSLAGVLVQDEAGVDEFAKINAGVL